MLKKFTFLPSAQLYLSLAIMFGTWVIYIPNITEKLKMSEGQLGIALFFAAIGSLLATPIGKILTNKFGEGKVSFYSVLSLSFFVVTFFIVNSFYWLSIALFFYGFSSGILQVGMNSLVAAIEKETKVSIMSTCHGFYSLGGIISSGLGTILLIAIGNPLIHVLLSAVLVLALQFSFKKHFYSVKNQHIESGKTRQKGSLKNRLLWILAVVALSVMVTEGAIADWSGLYLKNVALTKSEYLGLGYAGFSLSMTIGRFVGDYFSKRYGALQIILTGFMIGLLGFLTILSGHSILSIFGFFVVGIGFSIIVPEIYRLSANIDGVDPATGIAFMAGSGYVGFLAGPVVLGAIAEQFGLKNSFIVLLGLVSIGAVFTIIIKSKTKIKLATN